VPWLLHRAPPLVKRRTPHLAHGAGGACRTAPIRWSREMRYGASPPDLDPAPLCPASSDRFPNSPVSPNVASMSCCFRSPGCARRIPCFEPATSCTVHRPVPIAPTGARQLAAIRLVPAYRGRANRSWVSAVMRWSSVTNRCGVAAWFQKREIAPPMFARDVKLRGWADVHASGVVHRLVNIGTRLPGRAL
jgi:hypothetical protein